ncbi:Hypothetical protein AJAP_30865 [Amycolatopsis japonica]|uniref:AB hydrolase-1 domain-containing protein n=1 Tax=Amycolatopsis japonica TaxID=208439 RepID=A0A075V7Z1_9PSEU|nr:alpha/beta hydrolase [Amycolatopsis japonica]AIG78995.1 Hypothetical protein AJAP_30865 [Amycolatopsis japonica]
MKNRDGYFPFELELEPECLGLVRGAASTTFGELHYVRTAEEARSGTQVTLFVHGVANDWSTWTPLLRQAEKDGVDLGDVILVDLPGFGESQNRKSDLESGEVGRVLMELVADCGYHSCRLVGHSMGGFLVLDMAGRGDDRIRSVHLVAGAYFSVIETVQNPLRSLVLLKKVAIAYWMQSVLAALGRPGLRMVKVGSAIGLLPLALNGFLAHPWGIGKSFRKSLVKGMRPDQFVLAAQNGLDYDPDQHWSEISCPIHAAFGVEDKLVPPRDMVRLAAICESAKTVLVGDSAHFPHVERPRETLAVLFETALS